jgi:hypothetical protein
LCPSKRLKYNIISWDKAFLNSATQRQPCFSGKCAESWRTSGARQAAWR